MVSLRLLRHMVLCSNFGETYSRLLQPHFNVKCHSLFHCLPVHHISSPLLSFRQQILFPKTLLSWRAETSIFFVSCGPNRNPPLWGPFTSLPSHDKHILFLHDHLSQSKQTGLPGRTREESVSCLHVAEYGHCLNIPYVTSFLQILTLHKHIARREETKAVHLPQGAHTPWGAHINQPSSRKDAISENPVFMRNVTC